MQAGLMTDITVHNTRGTAAVYTQAGQLIGPHQNRGANEGDPVTSRMLACGRLQLITRPEAQLPTPLAVEGDLERPALNAKTSDWQAYAQSLGFTPDDLAGLTRSDIIELIDAYASDHEEQGPDPDPEPEPEGEDPDGDDEEQEQEDQEATAHSGAETDTEQETS